jgi:hypothetical protein
VSAPAGDLLEAVRAVAERDDAESRAALYRTLLDAVLILPIPEDEVLPPEGVAGEDTRVRFFTTPPGEDGSWKMLAFTDEGALTAWRAQGCRHLLLGARDLFAMALSTPTTAILLNVAGPAGGEVTRREFATLAEGAIPTAGDATSEELHLEAGERIVVTTPERPPGEAFLGVLRMALDEAAPVRAAWLADVAFGAGELHPAVGVAVEPEAGDAALRAVFEGVMARVQPLLGHGRYLDFIVLDEVWTPLFAEAGPPIYERGAST